MSKKLEDTKVKKGFWSPECFEPCTGQICSVIYFVLSLASVFCIVFLLTGGAYAKKARSYMDSTGDTDGVMFLAAGKALRTIAKFELLVIICVILVYALMFLFLL